MPPINKKSTNQTFPRTEFSVNIEGLPDGYYFESSVVEVTMTESLLSPSVQTIMIMQDPIHYAPNNKPKDLNLYKGKTFTGNFYKPDIDAELEVSHIVYRISNRKPINDQVEQYEIHCIDNFALKNVTKRMSKYFKCTNPSDVVKAAMSCAGVIGSYVQPSGPVRDYNAANIHPYQVMAQQADVALDGNDPSFLHYMTLENVIGKQYFQSIKRIASLGSIATYTYTEAGAGLGYANPYGIMTYEFPCDFDLMSDLLNGLDSDGNPTNASLIVHNIWNGQIALMGSQSMGCGMGAGITKTALSNINSAASSGNCEVDVESYMAFRQARLALLENDKTALRIKVPFNPNLHVGNIITANFYNKSKDAMGQLEFGSGDYIICSLSHNCKSGGFSTTVLDLVNTTVGQGEV